MRQSRARGEGRAWARAGLMHTCVTGPTAVPRGYITCDEHEGVSMRVPDSDMRQGDAQVICERERGRAQG